MLDLDAIEKEITADKYGDKRFGPQCLKLIAELRKCRAAMEEASKLMRGIAAYKPEHDWNVAAARSALNEALRGEK